MLCYIVTVYYSMLEYVRVYSSILYYGMVWYGMVWYSVGSGPPHARRHRYGVVWTSAYDGIWTYDMMAIVCGFGFAVCLGFEKTNNKNDMMAIVMAYGPHAIVMAYAMVCIIITITVTSITVTIISLTSIAIIVITITITIIMFYCYYRKKV